MKNEAMSVEYKYNFFLTFIVAFIFIFSIIKGCTCSEKDSIREHEENMESIRYKGLQKLKIIEICGAPGITCFPGMIKNE